MFMCWSVCVQNIQSDLAEVQAISMVLSKYKNACLP